MNGKHFLAIVRMQWQIRRNRFRRSTQASRLLTYLVIFLVVFGSLGSFILSLFSGRLFLSKAGPIDMMYTWDVVVCLFLFAWMTGVMVELQRSEMLSLKNLLHLPVSLSGAFFLNYASSLLSLTVLLFLPGMLGLCFASTLHFGFGSLVVFPLLFSFLLMVTALSYQLRGWLARLMENKRTRGTVIAITTTFFILIFQVPNLINMRSMRSSKSDHLSRWSAHDERLADLKGKLDSGEIEPAEYLSGLKLEAETMKQQRSDAGKSKTESTSRVVKVANMCLPIGWLPYGASAAAGGAILVPWFCVLGMATIGLGSLSMAYRSTIRVYTGHQNKNHRSTNRDQPATRESSSMLEKNIPLLSETQSVIALATLRSILRAPEAKMALVTPIIFAGVFGSMVYTGPISQMPAIAKPFLSVAAITMALFGTAQMMINLFGLDRQGFRAYVLTPVPRRDILLGKNMGIFPLLLLLSVPVVVFVGVMAKLSPTHTIAGILQVILAYFLAFTVGNFSSINAPIGMVAGTMKPTSMNFSIIIRQFLAMLLMSMTVLPATLAIAAEIAANYFNIAPGYPIYLLLTLLQLPIAVWFYRKVVARQGVFLQDREQAILEVISKVAD